MARRKAKRTPPKTAAPTPWPRRVFYVEAVFVVMVCGLLWRRPELGLPAVAAKYGGSMLWGAMVFFCVAALKPAMDIRRIALWAAAVSALVEFSQLIHFGPLDQFRRTTAGALLLGRTFTWWDIAAYWVGIAVAALAIMTMAKRRGGR